MHAKRQEESNEYNTGSDIWHRKRNGMMKEIQKSQVLPNSVYCIVNGPSIKKNPITNDSKAKEQVTK